jgi:hypothetical protein
MRSNDQKDYLEEGLKETPRKCIHQNLTRNQRSSELQQKEYENSLLIIDQEKRT